MVGSEAIVFQPADRSTSTTRETSTSTVQSAPVPMCAVAPKVTKVAIAPVVLITPAYMEKTTLPSWRGASAHHLEVIGQRSVLVPREVAKYTAWVDVSREMNAV